MLGQITDVETPVVSAVWPGDFQQPVPAEDEDKVLRNERRKLFLSGFILRIFIILIERASYAIHLQGCKNCLLKEKKKKKNQNKNLKIELLWPA